MMKFTLLTSSLVMALLNCSCGLVNPKPRKQFTAVMTVKNDSSVKLDGLISFIETRGIDDCSDYNPKTQFEITPHNTLHSEVNVECRGDPEASFTLSAPLSLLDHPFALFEADVQLATKITEDHFLSVTFDDGYNKLYWDQSSELLDADAINGVTHEMFLMNTQNYFDTPIRVSKDKLQVVTDGKKALYFSLQAKDILHPPADAKTTDGGFMTIPLHEVPISPALSISGPVTHFDVRVHCDESFCRKTQQDAKQP
jgi:hypothetical protein